MAVFSEKTHILSQDISESISHLETLGNLALQLAALTPAARKQVRMLLDG